MPLALAVGHGQRTGTRAENVAGEVLKTARRWRGQPGQRAKLTRQLFADPEATGSFRRG